MNPIIDHIFGSNPFLGLNYREQNFNLRKDECEIGCLEGAHFPSQNIFLVSGIEVLEEHRNCGYSLKLLKHMSDEYHEPEILLHNLTNENFWKKILKKKIVKLNSIEDTPIARIKTLIENEN